MTDRRATITRGWRPAGAPARRVDDFVQAPAERVRITERRVRPDRPELADIDQRLQNWGRWNNAQNRTIERSATAAFCDRLRKEAGLYAAQSDERRSIDDADAYLLECSLLRLPGTQKAILRMKYVQGRAWQPIMRVLQFPVQADLWAKLLENAQEAIEAAAQAR